MSAPWPLLGLLALACVAVRVPGVRSDPPRMPEPLPSLPTGSVSDWWGDHWDDFDCQVNGCQNGGTCHTDDSFGISISLCECQFGTWGHLCEHTDNDYLCDAATAPCMNGGTCIDNSFCQCATGWEGYSCTERTACYNYCENGGSCYMSFGFPECICEYGWEGHRCSRLDGGPGTVCDNYCENGGACYVSFGLPECICDISWEGPTCSRPKGSSELLCLGFCGNRGSCYVDRSGQPTCRCTEDWGGEHCEDYLHNYSLSTGVFILLGAVGSIVQVLIIICCLVLCIRASGRRRQGRQPPPTSSVATPTANNPNLSVIYHPAAHNLAFAEPAAVPAGKYPGDGINNNGPPLSPQRYTNPMAGNSAASGGGQLRYDYAVQRPGGGVATSPPPPREGARPPMVGPRSELTASAAAGYSYDYAYAHAPAPPAYAPSDPARESGAAARSGTSATPQYPSRAGSRMTDHTYQSISEYQALESVKSGGASSVHSVTK